MPDFSILFQAIADRHWPLLVAIGLTFVVYFIRGIAKEKIPTKYLPCIVLGVAVLSAVAARMIDFITRGHTWWFGLIQGVVEGLAIGLPAMGWWSVGVKRIPGLSSNKLPE